MTEFKQTWWDKNLPDRFDEFNSWIGDKNATSKVFCREIVKKNKYKTLADFGCGTATEFFAYKEEYPELRYVGIDSCEALVHRNRELGVTMLKADVNYTLLPDSSWEVSFSRHVLEHQPVFEDTLTEMIRVASKVAMHVFFIKPRREPEAIGFDPSQDLYHNRYDTDEIESYLHLNEKVKRFEWMEISDTENLLMIYLE
jgi:ubiquinone/menaquinone biosynthesis C-methylase UbiE